VRYAIVTPKGEVNVQEADVLDADTIGLAVGTPHTFRAVEPDETCVFFINNDPYSGLDYNWLVTHALNRRLHPQDKVTGSALVTGPVDFEGHPTEVTDETIARLKDMSKR
jgi:hypothetical protein